MDQNKAVEYEAEEAFDLDESALPNSQDGRKAKKSFQKRFRQQRKWERQRQRQQRRFLLKQLVQRDFRSRYKRAALGVLWSMLSPLCNFAAQALVFSFFFRRGEHFISYLITGNIVYHYFTDATTQCMFAITGNLGIISRVNVNQEVFLISRTFSSLINFCLTASIMFAITTLDHMPFARHYVALLFPVLCLFCFNLGVGYILATLHVFFRDIQYLYGIFTHILMYFSAIYYKVENFPPHVRELFLLNPVYCYISYFRSVIINRVIPPADFHILCAAYAVGALLLGKAIYTLCRDKLSYYY